MSTRRVSSLGSLPVLLLLLACMAVAHLTTAEAAGTPTTRTAGRPVSRATPYPQLLSTESTGPSFGPKLTPEEERAYISARYGSSSKVSEVRNAIPRWGYSSNFDPADSDYQMSIIAQVGPGAACLVLTLLIWIGFSFWQCCNKGPKSEGYTRRQRIYPLAFGFVFTLVIIAFSIIGALYTEEFDKQLVGEGSLVDTTHGLLRSVSGFFGGISDSVTNVRNTVLSLGPQASTKIDSFGVLTPTLPQFFSDFRAMSTALSTQLPISIPPVDPDAMGAQTVTFECAECDAIPTNINKLITEMEDITEPVLAEIEDTKIKAKQEVADAVGDITSEIDSARYEIDDLKRQVNDYERDVTDMTDYVDQYEVIRRAVVLVIWLLPLLICLMYWIFVVWRKKERAAKILVHALFFSGFFVWLIFLIHLPFSMLIADSCHYLDEVEVDLGAKLDVFDVKVSNTLTACLTEQNLLRPLGLEEQLNFTESVVFPEVPEIDDLLKDTTLQDINADVQALTLSDFGDYDPADKDTALDQFNQAYEDEYGPGTTPFTFTTLRAHDPTTLTPPLRTMRNYILQLVDAEEAMTDLLNTLQTGINDRTNDFGSMKNSALDILTKFQELEDLLDPLFAVTQQVIDSSYCSAVGEGNMPLNMGYQRLKGTFCDEMVVSVSSQAMSSFFVGFFLFFLNFVCWFSMYRLEHEEGWNSAATQDEWGITSEEQFREAQMASEGDHAVQLASMPIQGEPEDF